MTAAADAIRGLSLYHFPTCGFCLMVRRAATQMGLELPLVDASRSPGRDELLAGGGDYQAPCLRIEDADGVRWLYESRDIIAYLQTRLDGG